jgi:hypothetical protein
MPQIECATCEALRGRAAAASTVHFKLVSRLETAKLSYDSRRIATLEPLLEMARIQRERSVAEYVAHGKTHEQANSAEAGT